MKYKRLKYFDSNLPYLKGILLCYKFLRLIIGNQNERYSFGFFFFLILFSTPFSPLLPSRQKNSTFLSNLLLKNIMDRIIF